MLCSDLATLLQKTLLACCEVNVKYGQHLEILGSLYIRADSQELLHTLVKQTVNKCGELSPSKRKHDDCDEGEQSWPQDSSDWCVQEDGPEVYGEGEEGPGHYPEEWDSMNGNAVKDEGYLEDQYIEESAHPEASRCYSGAGRDTDEAHGDAHWDQDEADSNSHPQKTHDEATANDVPAASSTAQSGPSVSYSRPDADNYWGPHKRAAHSSNAAPTTTSSPSVSVAGGVPMGVWAGPQLYQGPPIPLPGAPVNVQSHSVSATVLSGGGLSHIEQQTTVINEQVRLVTAPPPTVGQGPGHLKACNICGRKFGSAHCLQIHLRQEHSITGSGIAGAAFYKCSKCAGRFATLEQLQQHMLLLHPEKQSSGSRDAFKCSICKVMLPTRGGYQDHMAEKHGRGWTVECKVCGKKFRNEQTLYDHRRSHHGYK